MPNSTKSTSTSKRNRADALHSKNQRNITMAINRHATSLEYTNALLYSVTLPTSAEIFNPTDNSRFTIGENTTVRELLEQLKYPDFADSIKVFYGPYGDYSFLYPVYLSDKSAKAISTIWSAKMRHSNLPHIPITEGKINIMITSYWGGRMSRQS